MARARAPDARLAIWRDVQMGVYTMSAGAPTTTDSASSGGVPTATPTRTSACSVA
jgi:hypothetical protein